MLEQIKQVSLTYLTQRLLWWIAGGFSLFIVPNLVLTFKPNRSASDAAHSMVFLVGMPMLMLLPFLVGHLKSQFAHSRARLMPRFLPAHLVVLCGILVTLFVLHPWLEARLAGSEPLGLLALAAAIGVPALWGAHLNRLAPLLVSVAAFYSLLTNWGHHWWIVEAPAHREIHASILGAGAVLVIAWLWRLCHLQEEMDDYQNVYQLLMARRTGSEAVEQRRIVAAQVRRSPLMSRIGDWWHHRLGGYYGGSPAGLARVLRYGFSAIPIEIQGLFMAAMFVSMGIFFSRFSFLAKSGAMSGGLFFIAPFAILMPGQLAGEMMAQRRPRIAFEMLLPLSRKQLINGLFAAAARNSFTQWLIMNTGLAIVFATTDFHFSSRAIALFLLLSVSTMFAAMAIGLRVSVWPSMAKRFTALWASWMVLLAPLGLCMAIRETVGDAPFIFGVIVLVGAGVWLLNSARQAWLNLEFV